MLKRIEINNYKMFRNFEMDFTAGISLICGPNGSGKSALREVIYTLGNFLATPDATERVAHSVIESFPAEVFCRWLPKEHGFNEIEINVEIGEEHEWFRYCLTVSYNFIKHLCRVQEETLDVCTIVNKKHLSSFSNGNLKIYTDDERLVELSGNWDISGVVTGSRNNSRIREFGAMIAKVYAVHFVPTDMKQDFTKGSSIIGRHGEYFPAWYFHNANKQLEKQLWVMEQCKNFIPGFISVNSPQNGDAHITKMRVNYMGKNHDITIGELSDGQKVLFALYSLLANVPDGSTLLIDEPENFIAPGELQPWLDAINDTWEERNIQFLLITHNPKSLNWYHKNANIFCVVNEPPRIEVEKNSVDSSGTLYEKLSEMEWFGNGEKS